MTLGVTLLGFNGAAASQPRRAGTASRRCAERRASMGPRLLSRGEWTQAWSECDGCSLQWGRGFSAAERLTSALVSSRYTCFNGAAASQPRRGHKAKRKLPQIMGFNGAAASQPRREYLRNFNERKGLNRLLRAARSTFLLNAVVSPMQDS